MFRHFHVSKTGYGTYLDCHNILAAIAWRFGVRLNNYLKNRSSSIQQLSAQWITYNQASQCSKHLLFGLTCPGVGLVLLQPILPAQQISAPRALKFRPSMLICLVKVTFQLVRPSESLFTLFAGKGTSLAALAFLRLASAA
jgi:hypothetical protein